MRRKSEIVLLSVCTSILVWMVLSFFDINAHNMTDQDYAGWNIFLVFAQDEQPKEDEFLPIINAEPNIEHMVCRKIERKVWELHSQTCHLLTYLCCFGWMILQIFV